MEPTSFDWQPLDSRLSRRSEAKVYEAPSGPGHTTHSRANARMRV
jgi:hypothetical protein